MVKRKVAASPLRIISPRTSETILVGVSDNDAVIVWSNWAIISLNAHLLQTIATFRHVLSGLPDDVRKSVIEISAVCFQCRFLEEGCTEDIMLSERASTALQQFSELHFNYSDGFAFIENDLVEKYPQDFTEMRTENNILHVRENAFRFSASPRHVESVILETPWIYYDDVVRK